MHNVGFCQIQSGFIVNYAQKWYQTQNIERLSYGYCFGKVLTYIFYYGIVLDFQHFIHPWYTHQHYQVFQ